MYEILVLCVILLAFRRLNRVRWRGQVLVWFVFLYGLGRPLTEVFRAPEEREPFLGPLTASQCACLAAATVSGVMLLVFRYRKNGRGHRPSDALREAIRTELAAHPH